jgi:hypothetical protein
LININEDVNFIYFNQIDKIYTSFENSLDNFKNITCLIYKIYYKNDQFNVVNDSVKSSLKTMISLLIKN